MEDRGVYDNGQQVEVNENGTWILGLIQGVANYTVRYTATGRNITRQPNQVRLENTLDQNNTGANTNIMPGSQVEFQNNPRQRYWPPGTLVSKNYIVQIDGRTITVPHTRIRRPGQEEEAPAPQPAAAQPHPPNPERAAWRANVARWRAELARPAQPQQAPRPTGVAHEVHNAFADLDIEKFMSIIRRENNGASDFKNTQNILRPLFQYINSSDTTLSPEQKTRYKTNFRKPEGIIENVEQFISDHPEVIADTREVIQFVLSQDPKYKDLYIETFENECMGGYSTGDRKSCTKGMWERIYLANKGTIQGLCFDELEGNATSAAATSASSSSSTSCKPLYLELYNTFTPGADIDINDIFQKWYNQFSYDAVPEEENPLKNLSIDARKQHYRDFVRQDEVISQKIWNNEDFQKKLENSIKRNEKIFETLDYTAAIGGRRRKTNKKRSVRKNNRSKRSVIKTIKKRKNKTIKKRR